MKLPLIATIAGVLIGIGLVVVASPETTGGIALLIFICVLVTNLIAALLGWVFRRKVP